MRDLSPDMVDQVTAKSMAPAYLAQMFFDSGTIGMWTGVGQLTWGDKEFFGGGNLVGLSKIEETQELVAKGLVASLNGIPAENIALSQNERVRGRPFRLYFSAIDMSDNSLVNTPYRCFAGLMDKMEYAVNPAGEASIRLSVENLLIVGQRTKVSRYTQEDQRKRYPSDKGFSLINQLQDKEVVW